MTMTENDIAQRTDGPLERATDALTETLQEVKPVLRGWLHAGSVPLLTAAMSVLIALSPTPAARVGNAVYAASAVLLFTVSGIYHRGTWTQRAWEFWRRFDHGNIYVFIAGTCTAFATLYLPGQPRTALLLLVWLCALAGVTVSFWRIHNARWLSSCLYLALGSVPLLFAPAFIDGAGQFPTWVNVTALSLVAVGGALYTLGGAVYAVQRPNPSPRWFGFHEVFHACTVLAFIAHYIAISVVTYSLR